MARSFPSSTIQGHSQRLRNEICRLATPLQMAEVSSHLRNFAVAEAAGFIALLDGHPAILGKPAVAKARAAFQQTQGTTANPLAHAIPSDMLLNGGSLAGFYHSEAARNALERVFGMGVMAPQDWEDQGTFPSQPRQNNIVDAIAERHHYGGGLVDAFKTCGEAAVANGVWDGSGKRRHDFSSLAPFIASIYENTWVPKAGAAYRAARAHLARQIAGAGDSDPARRKVLEQRRDILDAQIAVFERERRISMEAARNVWKFAAGEVWN